jgi:hypothetical protein
MTATNIRRPRTISTLINLTLAERATTLGPDTMVMMPDGRIHTLGNVVTEHIADPADHTVVLEYTKIKAYSKTTDEWLDLLAVIVVADPPTPRPVLELSTAHLPEGLGSERSVYCLDRVRGVAAYPLANGWLMWVPDDPPAHAADYDDEVPLEVLTIQRYARALHCDWVMFDADGAATDDLPRWDW